MSEIIDSNTNLGAKREPLRGSGGVLTLGILSIVFAGLIGIILAIVALSMSRQPLADYAANPERYDESSYRQMKAGKVCAIIGLSLVGLALVIVLLAIAANA